MLTYAQDLQKFSEMSRIQQWVILSRHLKEVKTMEMALRREICGEQLEGEKLPARKKFVDGAYELKAENGITHVLDASELNAFWQELSDEEKSAVKFTPELKLREYKKLPEDALLRSAVTTKPSAPTLTVL